MGFAYPVFLELRGKRAVVIGSLALEEGKDAALRSAGARSTCSRTAPGGPGISTARPSAWRPLAIPANETRSPGLLGTAASS